MAQLFGRTGVHRSGSLRWGRGQGDGDEDVETIKGDCRKCGGEQDTGPGGEINLECRGSDKDHKQFT